MFGLFKKVIVEDPRLGPMRRRGQRWEGELALTHGRLVPLDIEGTKTAPHPETLACAYQLPDRLSALVPIISRELLAHLEPYRNELADPRSDVRSDFDNLGDVDALLAINTPELAWEATAIAGVEIGLDAGRIILLLKLDTKWDLEHTVGAYFEDWRFQLLNGSV